MQGVVAVTASATDDVGVASVQFQVNGVDLGVADTAAPYTLNWDTHDGCQRRLPSDGDCVVMLLATRRHRRS